MAAGRPVARGHRRPLIAMVAVAAVLMVAVAVVAVRGGDGGTAVKTATIVSVVPSDDASADVVYLAGQGEGCGEPAGVHVEEGDDVVVFTARITYATSAEGEVCSLIGTHRRETVPLRRPVGTRRVVDGSNGREVPRAATPAPPAA